MLSRRLISVIHHIKNRAAQYSSSRGQKWRAVVIVALLVILPAASNGFFPAPVQIGRTPQLDSHSSLLVNSMNHPRVATHEPKRTTVMSTSNSTETRATGTGGMYGEDCSSAHAQISTDPTTVYVLTVTPRCAPVGSTFDLVATPSRAIAVAITGEPHGWPCAGACRVGVTNGGGDVHISVSIFEVRLYPTLCIAPDHTKWIYWGTQTTCSLRPGNPNYVPASWPGMYGDPCRLEDMGVADNPASVAPSCARVGARGTTFHIQGLYGDRALHIHLTGTGNTKTCWGECDVVLRDGGGRVVVDGPTKRGYLYPTLCIAPDHTKWIYWGTQTTCSLRPGNPNYVPASWPGMYGDPCRLEDMGVTDNPATVAPSCARVGRRGTTFHIQGLYGDHALRIRLSGKDNTKTCRGECDVVLRDGGGSVAVDGPTKRGYLYPTLCIAPNGSKWIYWGMQSLCPLRPGNPNYVAPSWHGMFGNDCTLVQTTVADNPATVAPSCVPVRAHGTRFHIQGLYGDRALHIDLSGKGNSTTCWGECDVVLRDGGGSVAVDGPTKRGYLYPTLCIAPDHTKWIYWGTQVLCPKGAVIGSSSGPSPAPTHETVITTPDVKVVAFIHAFNAQNNCIPDLTSNPTLVNRTADLYRPQGVLTAPQPVSAVLERMAGTVGALNAIVGACHLLNASANSTPYDAFTPHYRWSAFIHSMEYRAFAHVSSLRVMCVDGKVVHVVLPTVHELSFGFTKVQPFGFHPGDAYQPWTGSSYLPPPTGRGGAEVHLEYRLGARVAHSERATQAALLGFDAPFIFLDLNEIVNCVGAPGNPRVTVIVGRSSFPVVYLYINDHIAARGAQQMGSTSRPHSLGNFITVGGPVTIRQDGSPVIQPDGYGVLAPCGPGLIWANGPAEIIPRAPGAVVGMHLGNSLA